MSVPEPESAVIETVLGLDTRPRPTSVGSAKSGSRSHRAEPASHAEVAEAYDYPTTVNGTGQCIALIELGGGY